MEIQYILYFNYINNIIQHIIHINLMYYYILNNFISHIIILYINYLINNNYLCILYTLMFNLNRFMYQKYHNFQLNLLKYTYFNYIMIFLI